MFTETPLRQALKGAAVLFFTALSFLACFAYGQDTSPGESLDPARLKEVNTRLGELKKLLEDHGMGHPKVQEQVRKIRSLEEELRSEQSFIERVAAQLQTAENDLRKRQANGWKELSAIQADFDVKSIETVPSPETIEVLERECLVELQRINWELGTQGLPSTSDSPLKNVGPESSPNASSQSSGAKDAVPASGINATSNQLKSSEIRLSIKRLMREAAQLKLKAAQSRHAALRTADDKSSISRSNLADSELTVKLLALELQIAEAELQAVEVELSNQHEKSLPVNPDGLKKRQAVVKSQLQKLQIQKELSRKIADIRKTNEQLSDQIRELETQRFQHQSKSVEHQALLDLVHHTLNPNATTGTAPKAID